MEVEAIGTVGGGGISAGGVLHELVSVYAIGCESLSNWLGIR